MSDQVEKTLVYYETKIKNLEQQLSKAQVDLELAVEALEFYANALSFNDYKIGEDLEGDMIGRTYYGKRARQTLKQIKEKKE